MQFITITGNWIDLNNVTADDIAIYDIAHALSNQCRFAGHTHYFYSVAQHCIRVAKALPPVYRVTGLLHDAAEAYVLDLPRPVKEKLPVYKELEKDIQKLISDKYRLIAPQPSIIKQMDELALITELKELTLCAPPFACKTLLPYEPPMAPTEARYHFLRLFADSIVAHYNGLYGIDWNANASH